MVELPIKVVAFAAYALIFILFRNLVLEGILM